MTEEKSSVESVPAEKAQEESTKRRDVNAEILGLYSR